MLDARSRHGAITPLRLLCLVSLVEALALTFIEHLRLDGSGILTVYDLTYVDGNLIRNIALHWQYRVCGTQLPNEWGDMCFSAHRLPLIPVMAAAVAVLLTSRITVLLLIKNLCGVVILNIAVLVPIIHMVASTRTKLVAFIPIAMVLGAPIVLNTAGQVEYEEAYSLPLFALMFALLTSNLWSERIILRTTLACVSLAFLSMMKSTYLLVDFVFAALWLIGGRDRHWVASLPLGCLMLALLGWGAFAYHTSGHVALGSSMSSFNGWNLYKGNNPSTINVYPYYLDQLDQEGLLKPDRAVRDEWDLNDYYVAKTIAFVGANPVESIKLAAIKIETLFISYFANGPRRHSNPQIDWFFISAKMVLQMAIATALWTAVRDRQWQWRWRSITFLLVVAAYSVPLIAGFGYDRHLVLPCVAAAMFLSARLASALAESDASGSAGSIPPVFAKGVDRSLSSGPL